MTVLGPGGYTIGSGEDAALLLHGFASGPEEMRFVAERLAAEGMRAVAMTVPGHETSPEDLEQTPWTEWYAGVQRVAADLAASSRRVFGVGFSTGGALLLRLAALEPDRFAALVSLSTPLRLGGPALLYPVVQGIRLDRVIRFWPKPIRDIRDREARRANPSYSKLPLRSVGELRALLADLRPRVGAITAPILVVHSRRDHTVSYRNAKRIIEGVSSPIREKLTLRRSFHVVTVDVEREVVASAVAEFLGRFRSP